MGQQLLGGLEPGPIGVIAFLNQTGLHLQPGFVQRGDETIVAPRAGTQVVASADETDAAVTLGNQVLGHFLAGVEVVDADAGDIVAEAPRCDGDDRDAGLDEFRQGHTRLAQRWRQENAVNAGTKRTRRLAHGFGIHVVPVIDNQLDGGTRGDAQQADQQFAQIGAAGVGVDQCNARVLRGGQRTRGQVGRVVQLAHGTHDPLARGIADLALVERSGHGHRRYASQGGHLIDRHATVLAADRFLRLVHCVFPSFFVTLPRRCQGG
ncbi:hypothetical protein D3C81_663700 [compost metagenome]